MLRPLVPLLALLAAAPGVLPAPKPAQKPAAKPASAKPAVTRPTAPVRPVSPAPASATPVEDLSSLPRGPLDLGYLADRKQAAVTLSPALTAPGEEVSWPSLFDGNIRAGLQLQPNPAGLAFVQAELTAPRVVEAVSLSFLPQARGTWTLHAAATAADLLQRKSSYRLLVPTRPIPASGYDQADLASAGIARFFRLELKVPPGAGAETAAGLAEWELWSPQKPVELRLDAFARESSRDSVLPLRVQGRLDGGGRLNITDEVSWEITPPGAGAVDHQARFAVAASCAPGPVRIAARYQGLRSTPLELEVRETGQPDWDVTHIERQPPLHYNDPSSGLKLGQNVYWFAHVRNYGTMEAPPVNVEWRIDGKLVSSGRLPKLERFTQTEVILSQPWDGKRHTVELVVDPEREAAEPCESNNRLAILTDARPIGFWVEEAVRSHFHQRQRNLYPASAGGGNPQYPALDANSWEDWAQRQIGYWNRWSETAERMRLFTTPSGQGPRWRLDRVITVGDGMLPLSNGHATLRPDSRDDISPWQYGFPAATITQRGRYGTTGEVRPGNPFYVDLDLMRRAFAALKLPTQ